MKKIHRIHCTSCGYVVQGYDDFCPSCHKNLHSTLNVNNTDTWYIDAVKKNAEKLKQEQKDRKRKKLRELRIEKLNKIEKNGQI